MKRLIALVLSVMIVTLLLVGTTAVSDFNGDSVCDIKDVLVIISSLLNKTDTGGMDVNGDGKFGLLDIISVLKAAVSSDDTDEITSPTFVVSDVSASAGERSVSVPVSIVKNPGILGMTLVVSYDDTAMTLVNSANGDALSMLSFTKPSRYKSGSIFTWYGEALDDSDIVDGEVLILTFDISETASDGIYPIEISYVEGDIFNADLAPAEIAIRSGSCAVVGSGAGGDAGGGDSSGGDGDTDDTDEITSPTFVVSDVSASAGERSVSVPVSIVKNPGILGMTLVVSYDDTAMTLVNSANGDALSMLSFTKPKKYKSGSIFTWYGEALDDGEIVDGGVLTLTFDISSSAVSGTYPVWISYVEGDIFDADLAPVEIAIKNGDITIVD